MTDYFNCVLPERGGDPFRRGTRAADWYGSERCCNLEKAQLDILCVRVPAKSARRLITGHIKQYLAKGAAKHGHQNCRKHPGTSQRAQNDAGAAC